MLQTLKMPGNVSHPFGYMYDMEGNPEENPDPLDMNLNHAAPLLGLSESNLINDFFNQGPTNEGFTLDPSWGNGFLPDEPPQVHDISVIPNQQHLSDQPHFANQQHLPNQPHLASQQHIPNQQHPPRQHDTAYLQQFAPSLSYNQSQNSVAWDMAPRPRNFGTIPSNGGPGFDQAKAPPPSQDHQEASGTRTQSINGNGVPMVPTSNGPVHEQIASMLPLSRHSDTVDAQFAADFARVHPDFIAPRRPALSALIPQRHFSFGTDTAFDRNGYRASDPMTEEKVTERLNSAIEYNVIHGGNDHLSPPVRRKSVGRRKSAPSGSELLSTLKEEPHSQAVNAEEEMPDADEDPEDVPPTKRRKCSTSTKNGSQTRRASPKRKRGNGTPGTGRAVLTERQKRENHIRSEQKRRNQIKKATERIRHLVPGLKSQNTNKAGELAEARSFLTILLQRNAEMKRLLGEGPDQGGPEPDHNGEEGEEE